MKRVLAFPPDTKVEWKSHDSSIAQRTAIDDARKEKGAERGAERGEKRNGAKDEEKSERSERAEHSGRVGSKQAP